MKVEVLDSKKANVLISRFNLNATQHRYVLISDLFLPKYTSYFLCYGNIDELKIELYKDWTQMKVFNKAIKTFY